MFALIDGNSFYCSCERVFRPDLKNTPIAVLSNNDGCVVSRTAEVKAMGVAMGTPYFRIKPLADAGKLAVFSSNYELYAELSARMMRTIADLVPSIEIYSIDECFADVAGITPLRPLGDNIRRTVLQNIGIPTCVGIAPTKTLAKFCNHIAKRYRNHFNGVVVWNDWPDTVRRRALASEAVTEIWGIGRRLGRQLETYGIRTAWDLVCAHTPTLRKHFGVVLERTQREMQGIPCIDLHPEETQHQSLIRSRSFAHRITDLPTLQAAVSHHIASGAAALREQNTQANIVGVFIYTDRFRTDLPQYCGRRLLPLPQPSGDTVTLNRAAQQLLKAIYQPGYEYKKCGIELNGIEPAGHIQNDLWAEETAERLKLMNSWDEVTRRFGRGKLKLGSELLSDRWKMARGALSPCYTTRWADLPVVD